MFNDLLSLIAILLFGRGQRAWASGLSKGVGHFLAVISRHRCSIEEPKQAKLSACKAVFHFAWAAGPKTR